MLFIYQFVWMATAFPLPSAQGKRIILM